MKYAFTIIISFFSLPLLSHPHVFIDNRVSVIFDSNGLKGFKHEWIFDEMFSSTIIKDFDLDGNGNFNKKEIEGVLSGAFSNLKKYNYFTDIAIKGHRFKIKEIEDFHAVIDSGVLIYVFFLPCEVTASRENQEITIAVYDPSYFVQILWASDNPYTVENTPEFELTCEVIEDEKKAYYYKQIIPESLKIKFRKNS
jgi:ABC-type uncharacterized transport system substrate-binding protein